MFIFGIESETLIVTRRQSFVDRICGNIFGFLSFGLEDGDVLI